MQRTRSLGLALAVLAVTAGCATAPRAQNVNMEDRNVNVTKLGTDGCAIAPDIKEVRVINKNSAKIAWHVKPADDFMFTADGIKFVLKDGATKLPGDDIQKINSSDTNWNVHDHNLTAGTFAYEVNVVRKAGGTPCRLDPIIFNDGTCDPTVGPC